MFNSFFIAGFECATGLNKHGRWIDQIAATGHDACVFDDYRLLDGAGIRTIREGVRWPLIDKDGRFDFRTLYPMIDAANHYGLTVIWDLFHYGYPPGLNIFSETFLERFQQYVYAAARLIRQESRGPYFFTPVNEPSYLAYAAGEKGMFAPHLTGRGWDLKVALSAAAIRGTEALWAACPSCRIVHVDPVCRITGKAESDEAFVDDFNNRLVFQSFDIISGKILPELGGSPKHLDIVGVNYYRTNQWRVGFEEMPLALDDPLRMPFSKLLETVRNRYNREIVVTETGDCGPARHEWLAYMIEEASAAIACGIPLHGMCIYPVLGMPEWHEPEIWAHMGLWDIDPADIKKRKPVKECLELIAAAEERLSSREAFATRPFPSARPFYQEA